MSRGWVDYRAVKAGVSMEMALATYGIQLNRLDHAYLRGRCPLPTHQSRTSLQSFIVNIRRTPGHATPSRVSPSAAGGLAATCSISLPRWRVVLFVTRPLDCASGSR